MVMMTYEIIECVKGVRDWWHTHLINKNKLTITTITYPVVENAFSLTKWQNKCEVFTSTFSYEVQSFYHAIIFKYFIGWFFAKLITMASLWCHNCNIVIIKYLIWHPNQITSGQTTKQNISYPIIIVTVNLKYVTCTYIIIEHKQFYIIFLPNRAMTNILYFCNKTHITQLGTVYYNVCTFIELY